MSSSYEIIRQFYQNRRSLPADRHILKVLKQYQSEFQPGNDLAKLTEMSLVDSPLSCHSIHKLASVSLLQTSTKNMMFLALEEESESVYRYVEEMLSKKLDVHTDIFLHYPYSKDRLMTHQMGESYCAKEVFSLDESGMSLRYPHVRFHYCDLRTEWHPQESEDHLYGRVELLNDYACYLAHPDIDRFTERILASKLSEQEILELDLVLTSLEGKIMKSFHRAENKELAENMIRWFQSKTADCRHALNESKKHLYEEPALVVQYYIDYLRELNHLYQYTNTLYAMLRMFRSFNKVSYQNSESPSHCIVVLPKQMVDWITEFIKKHAKPTYSYHMENSTSTINQCLLDELFQKWKK